MKLNKTMYTQLSFYAVDMFNVRRNRVTFYMYMSEENKGERATYKW